MILNCTNILDLKVGDDVWLVERPFQIPDKLTYVGILGAGTHYEYLILCDTTKLISILKKNPNSNIMLKSGRLTTSYEEVCEVMRSISIDTIDHFNKHQFKNKIIKVI